MKLFKRKANLARGASSKKPAPRKTLVSRRWLGVAALFCLVALLAAAAGLGVQHMVAQPVTRVVVNGEFSHVEKNHVADLVQPFLGAGFIRLELAAVRDRLLQEAWIQSVKIERRWPGELLIDVLEQEAIALWGNDAYLNNRGELFRPVVYATIESLPRLSGPDQEAERVMEHYRELSELLATAGLFIEALELDARGNWSLNLANHLVITVGKGEVMEKMRRLLMTYDKGLAREFANIEKIDMRYSNGFAVSWRASEDKIKAG